ncbi:MAG: hypothetical protein A2700_01470 [Candidatus Blackburnbacteria bacterium RIFCSPHIGHO2_01_FULL_44_64]|nr:MAG: hypothetical protein A2700_01470 [Candidatus Blackburnbacteria bacterium RIFCSPHIGHO2_01_FULL_44_64]OGY14189.1 MAG: hypothetical protein A3A62_01475 [Candidatus Blackburnbacteria bacterium RIFCSPLOWO2_01_FULL_44_43]
MDRIEKALSKLTSKAREQVKNIIKALQMGHFDNLDIKKLKGESGIFRARKGKLRIIYQIRNNHIFILKIGFRKENTYKLSLL